MNYKHYVKPSILLPIIIGIITGSVLFIQGEIGDAPGLCLMGLALCAGLMIAGVKNMHKINKNIKPIIVMPLFWGAAGALGLTMYVVTGNYNEPPGVILAGILVCGVLISIGILHIRKMKKMKSEIALIFLFAQIVFGSGGINAAGNTNTNIISITPIRDTISILAGETYAIEIKSASLDFVIEKSDDEKINIIKNFSEVYFTYSRVIDGNKITIESGDTNKKRMNIPYQNVVIQMPSAANLVFKSLNSDILINGIDCDSIFFKTVNGNVMVNSAVRDEAKIETTNGDVYVNAKTNAEIITVNGNIYYRGVITNENVDVRSMNGEVHIYLGEGSDAAIDITSENSYTIYNGNIRRRENVFKKVQNGAGKITGRTVNGIAECIAP